MSDTLHLAHKAAEDAGVPNAKVTAYANCVAIAFRNGDGQRVMVTVTWGTKQDDIARKIKAAIKVQPQNLPSEETLAKLND